jgi:hypothetical protein
MCRKLEGLDLLSLFMWLAVIIIITYFTAIGRSPGGSRSYTDTDKERL